MDEINYTELFGLGEGDKAQESAVPAPVEEDASEGEKEQDAADPAVGDDQEAGTDDPAADGRAEAKAEIKTGGQTAEENAAYAAARRKAEAERDAAVAQARAEAEESARHIIDEAFAGSGLTNPYTGQPINNKAEYDAYRTQYATEQRRSVMERAGMTQEEWDRYIASQPEVVQARKAEAEAQEVVRRAAQAEAKSKIEEQLRQISALDPGVNTLEDLTRQETYPRVYELVKQGLTLTDAYRLANYDRLTRDAGQAARQAAINSAAGKAHLTRTGQRGSGAVVVPEDVKEQYRLFVPDATDAEIQAHYARSHKE